MQVGADRSESQKARALCGRRLIVHLLPAVPPQPPLLKGPHFQDSQKGQAVDRSRYGRGTRPPRSDPGPARWANAAEEGTRVLSPRLCVAARLTPPSRFADNLIVHGAKRAALRARAPVRDEAKALAAGTGVDACLRGAVKGEGMRDEHANARRPRPRLPSSPRILLPFLPLHPDPLQAVADHAHEATWRLSRSAQTQAFATGGRGAAGTTCSGTMSRCEAHRGLKLRIHRTSRLLTSVDEPRREGAPNTRVCGIRRIQQKVEITDEWEAGRGDTDSEYSTASFRLDSGTHRPLNASESTPTQIEGRVRAGREASGGAVYLKTSAVAAAAAQAMRDAEYELRGPSVICGGAVQVCRERRKLHEMQCARDRRCHVIRGVIVSRTRIPLKCSGQAQKAEHIDREDRPQRLAQNQIECGGWWLGPSAFR
ncbi:hypothetical protein B0H14DRAFT_2642206 [Mycena olivaceomarginata]|nr:hypothetical protein B0H14DRAFT_2642206 [Mycena olivaceomarginata]